VHAVLSVGLTGGIGAGKSAVSTRLVELGAVLIDADQVAREVVEPGTPGLDAVVAAFGREVLAGDGSLDREALGRLVFAESDTRLRLNSIVHPLVGARTAELADQSRENGSQVLVHDVPLLVENGLGAAYHLVLVVQAPLAARLDRLTRIRGMPEQGVRARLQAQASDDERRSAADVVLPNADDLTELSSRVERLWHERLVPYADNLRLGRHPASGPVRLVPADPSWAAAGRRLVERLRWVCVPRAVDVQHIGSTAVPGLAAKDVLDLQVEVPGWDDVEALGPLLHDAGFPRREGIDADPPRPEIDPDPAQWRKRLHRNADPARAVNVHVRVSGSTAASCAVALRDLLRLDDRARAGYEAAKVRLAALYPDDVDAYAEGKSKVIVPLLLRALAP